MKILGPVIGWLRQDLDEFADRQREQTRRRRSTCVRCGYDTAGIDPAAPCPECGSPQTLGDRWATDGYFDIRRLALLAIATNAAVLAIVLGANSFQERLTEIGPYLAIGTLVAYKVIQWSLLFASFYRTQSQLHRILRSLAVGVAWLGTAWPIWLAL